MIEEQSTNESMEDTYYYYDDEAEETLSFFDYSINAEGEGEEYSSQLLKNSSSSSSSSSEQEQYFEFFSEEWSNSIVSSESCPSDSIIFCRKIIAYNEPTSQNNFQNLKSIKETRNDEKPELSFRWNGSHNRNRRKGEESVSMKRGDQKLRKVSSSSSSWALFLFGGTRLIPSEMALRDIRSRQKRLISSSSTMFRFDNAGDDEMMMMISNGRKNRSQQGLIWGLIKAVICGGQQHAKSVVRASMGCIPSL